MTKDGLWPGRAIELHRLVAVNLPLAGATKQDFRARREGQQLAGTGQSSVQVGRRKPAIRCGPAGGILSGSPAAGCGRVCEVTSGCFIEAKQEKRWLAVRPLRSDPAGRSGSKVPVRRQRKESLAGRRHQLVDLPVHPAAAERQVPRHSGQPPGEPAKVRCLRPRPFARASWPPAPSLWLTLTTHRQAGGGIWAGVKTAGSWPEVPGSIALEVSKYLVRLPRLRPRQDPRWTRGSSRI